MVVFGMMSARLDHAMTTEQEIKWLPGAEEHDYGQLGMRHGVCWSQPAYAGKCIFARNETEIACASLAAQSAANPPPSPDLRKSG